MKKLITYLAAAAIAINALGLNVFAEKNVDTALQNSIEALAAFGIINEEPQEVDTNAVLTREKAAVWMYKSMGLDNEYEKSVFYDVPVGTSGANAIMALNEWGIISGYPDGRFGPGEAISYNDYVTMLVRVLNYSVMADIYGGYPAGYIRAMQRLDLNKNVNSSAANELTVGDGAKMLYNALKTEMMDMEETLLSKYLDINMSSGRVTADFKTSLTSAEGVSEGKLKIDDTVYNFGFSEDWLGRYVNVFYTDKDGIQEIIYLENDKDVSEVKINAQDIVEEKSSRTNLVYEVGDAEEKIRISPVADIIYNGKAYPDLKEEELFIKCGEIKALDSDADKEYDVIFIDEYEVMFVDNVIDYSKTIYSKFNVEGFAGSVEIENDADLQIYDSYGEELEFSDIGVNNIVFIARSKTGSIPYYKIVVSDNIKHGILEEITEDYMVIDGEYFDVAYTFGKAIDTKLLPQVQVNREYYFYLDAYGFVSAYETVFTGKQYGYLKRAYLDFDTETPYLKIFCSDGLWRTYELKDEVMYDGKEYTKEAIAAIADTDIMVRYETDSKMRIKTLETPSITSQSDGTLHQKIEQDVFRKAEISSTLNNNKYYTMNKSFSNAYFTEDDLTVFLIPTEKGAPDEDFRCTDRSYFKSETRYTADIYDMDEYMFSSIIAIEYDSSDTASLESTIGEQDYCMMVDKAKDIYLNGELVSYVSGLLKGEAWSYTSSEAGTFNGLKRGDIIRTKYDASGKLKQYMLVHRYGNEDLKSNVADVNNAVYIYGDVLSVDYEKNRMRIDEGKELTVVALESAVITVYEAYNDEIRQGAVADITSGDYVVLRMRSSVPYEVFVIKQ